MKIINVPATLRARLGAPLLLAALLSVAGSARVALAGGESGDITCGGDQRFLVPGLCSKACKSQGLKMKYCALSPQTNALKAGGDEVMRQIQQQYNQAMFGRGIADYATARKGLGCTLINYLYPPYRCTKSFDVELVPSETGNTLDDPDYLAKFSCNRATGGNSFTFTSNFFLVSPAYMLSTIGHELVHADQCAHHSGHVAIGVDRVQFELDELEAYSWEAGKDNFPRTFKVKPSDLTIMRPDEAESVQAAYACAVWLTDAAVAQFLPGAPYSKYAGALRAYLQGDPWTNTVWLPQHPQWDKAPPTGKRPDNCKH
jgi:hypothetical protein